MKMTKTTYNLLLRLIAGIAAALILVGATALLTQSSKNLYQRASGVKTDSVVMTVDGVEIHAEDYLYWLSYYCDSCKDFLGYMGITDLNAELDAGLTAGDYMAQQAELQTINTLTQYAVIDNWAAEKNITLTQEDLASIAAQRAQSVEQLGGEKAYQAWLKTLGVSDSFITRSLEHSCLINHLQEAYCSDDGALRPDDAAIDAYLAKHETLSGCILFIDTCEMDEEAKAKALVQMQDYAETLTTAEDRDAAFAEIAEALSVSPDVATFTAENVEEAVFNAVKALEVEALSDVIETEEGYYLVIRKELDRTAILGGMLNEEFSNRCTNAEVIYNDKIYGAINPLSFYQKLVAAQSRISQ